MKKYYYVIKVSLERAFKEAMRYRFNAFAHVVSLYVLFMAMFIGVNYFGTTLSVSPVDLDKSLESFVAGYFIWSIIVLAYSDISYGIINDANRGTLEQISMPAIGLSKIVLIRSFCELLFNLILSFVLLMIIILTTGKNLYLNPIMLLIPIFLGIFAIFGIGLIFGGLALIYKRIQSVLSIVQYFMVGLVLFNSSYKWVSFLIPFRPAIDFIYDSMLGGHGIKDIHIVDLGIILGNAIIYLIIGIIIFKCCEKIAKKRGLLGQY